MSKMSKRFVSCVLAVAMMASLAPLTAFANEGNTASVSTTTENGEQSANGKVEEVNNAQALQNAINNATDGTETTIELGADILNLTTDQIITIPDSKNIVLNMNNHKITVATDFEGRPLKNYGVLTVKGNGTIDSSASNTGGYGAIDNYGTLTIENGTYTGSVNGSGASIKNRPNCILTINNGTFNGAPTAVYNEGITKIYNGLFDCHSCSSCNKNSWGYTIQSHKNASGNSPELYFYNGTVIGVQGAFSSSAGYTEIHNGSFETVACSTHTNGNSSYYPLYIAGEDEDVKCVVYGGTFKSVSKTAALIGNDNTNGDGGINANATSEIFGGTFIAPTGKEAITGATNTGNPIIFGGTFSSDPEKYVKTGYKAENSNGTWTVSAESPVAQIGDKQYASLEDAIDAASSGDTVTLLNDITMTDGILLDKGAESTITLDLNGFTYTVKEGANISNRGFKIQSGTLNVTDSSEAQTGEMIAEGSGTTSSNGTGAYGIFRVEANGHLNVENVTLKNSRPWGLNVKVCGGSATLTNVEIISSYGGGIEVTEANLGEHSQKGQATMNNCTVTQTGYFDHCSSAVSVSGGSKLTVNGGTYTSDGVALYVFSSGGDIEVLDGSFTGKKNVIRAEIDTQTYPEYTGSVQIKNGNYTGSFQITSPASLAITGGIFTNDPKNYLASGYKVKDLGNNTYKVIDADIHTITFDANGGSCDTATADTNGDGVLTTLPTPTRDGYTFDGWFTAKDGGDKVTTETTFSADTTLYAHWTKNSSGGGTVTPTPDPEEPSVGEDTVTNPDGSTTTTITKEDGSSSTTTVGTDGKVESDVTVSEDAVSNADGAAVALPIPEVPVTTDKALAPTVTVNLPSKDATKVEVPVKDVTPGTVAVLVDADGNETVIKDTVQSENGITIELTDGATIKVVDNSKSFDDVTSDYWGASAIDFATSRELFAGTGENTFSPEDDMTRAMIWSVLARYEGADTSGASGDEWYAGPQKWAIENGISDGTYPNASMTREQLAAMLYRYVGSPAVSGTVGDYSDADSISSWASDAMVWAVQEGLIAGMGENTLNPQGTATRTQVAAILQRFIENKMA